ncbi:MAG: response regulator [Candidatus Zixiibacteriota bacterium]|nr:MAG: response regulator [candidate division Zixibacteria bacterium]
MKTLKESEKDCHEPSAEDKPPAETATEPKHSNPSDVLSAILRNISTMFERGSRCRKLTALGPILIEHARAMFPDLEFCLVYRDRNSGVIQIKNSLADKARAESILNSLELRLAQLCCQTGPEGDSDSIWVNLRDINRSNESPVLASLLGNTRKFDIVLVALPPQTSAVSEQGNEVLTAFGSLARTMIKEMLMMRDMSRTQRLLKKSSDQLAGAETLAALTDMTSGMAHDFNNILGAVIGRVQLMKLKASEEDQLKDLVKVEKLLLEGAQTVRSIQEFSTSTRYKKPERVELVQLITAYASRSDPQWRKLAQQKNVRVDLQIAVKEAPVDGSPGDLTTVVEKIIENAVEHSYENGSIEVVLERANRNYRITIADHGRGIDAKFGKKIFYPFFTTKQVRGAGLGLAMAHGIVGRHRGKITVQSAPESGTIFEVLLPPADSEREDSDITHQGKNIRDLRILVVDDDEQIREVLADMLSIGGHAVTCCADGFSALEVFRSAHFDAVITDLGMAGMSGLDLAGLIQQEKPETPVALITGWGSQLNHDEVALKGIKAVIAKPFHLEEINALIVKLAAGKP